MTKEDLEVLAVYRNHKYCNCEDCIRAREILKEFDEKRTIRPNLTEVAYV